MSKIACSLFLSVTLSLFVSGSIVIDQQQPERSGNEDYIKPSTENPYYWEYKGEHLLLMGGSWQDNLFNHPKNLKEHLDLLSSVGGNYVRNVMSHRNAENVRFQAPGSGHRVVVILADDKKKEWVSLFNGENLDGWDVKISGYELNDNFGETFRVEDGLLKVRYDQYDSFDGRIGHIFYEVPFSYYRLQVEYRFTGEQVEGGPGWGFRNNGIMFHAQSAESMELDQNFPTSIEMQLLGGDGENERANGNIFTPGTQVVVDGELRTENLINAGGPTFHGDQWITAEVVVYGDSLAQHILNGELVIEYTDLQLEDGTPLDRGHIALQAESHPTDFRSVRILNLEGCMDENALNYKSYYVQSDPEACEY